ncbi:hypothetical protein EBN03_21670 [Nocardia stercoris]|uniref:Uncharacterized protein n=1 Tax=Nocardia stercoris TaxID=2483361 RepID=A0A3M2KYX6_9NOCA|nr:hypothetical protein EBN03_21670 [Nocardia stercoris]
MGAGLLAAGAAEAGVFNGAVTISTAGDTVTGHFTGVISSTDSFANCHLAYTAVDDPTVLGTGKDVKVPFGGAGGSASITVPDGTWDIYGYCSDLSTDSAPYELGPYTYTLQGTGAAPAVEGATNAGSVDKLIPGGGSVTSLLPAGSSLPNLLPPGVSGQ